MAHKKRSNPFTSLLDAVGNAVGFVILVPYLIIDTALSSAD